MTCKDHGLHDLLEDDHLGDWGPGHNDLLCDREAGIGNEDDVDQIDLYK